MDADKLARNREFHERARVCVAFCEGTDSEYLVGSNLGRMVNAAPELLAACRFALESAEHWKDPAGDSVLEGIAERCRAAIAKSAKSEGGAK
jgi:hypothetical protein